MIKIGEINSLEVSRETKSGYYLLDLDSNDEVFMPPALLTQQGVKNGDLLRAFVYHDKSGSLLATTKIPYAVVGQYALLEAIDVQRAGAFFDWGIDKDLLVPGQEQKYDIQVGEYCLVRVCLEDGADRIYGTTKLGKHIENSDFDVEEGSTVTAVPVIDENLGYRCIVNKKFIGTIYHNEIFSNIELNKPLKAYVKKIRVDGLLDLSIQPLGIDNLKSAKDKVLSLLKKSGGTLNLHDKSDPMDIQRQLQMSKKTFKSAIGILFKNKIISIERNGIRLLN